jgi:Xaa-Pro aminopeptidase
VRELGFSITSNISELAARVGHGLGMVVTEPPSINEEDPSRLLAGMIVTIEPGVATPFGTFHIEENVLITEKGHEVLTDGHWQLWKI